MTYKFKEKLKKYIGNKEESVVLGVSGGVDSIVLMHLFYLFEYKKVNIVHINHNIRKESKKDEELVSKISKKYGFNFFRFNFNIVKDSRQNKENLENYARKKRYESFEKIRKETGSKYIITAHHQDDLIESQLLHLIRGSLPGGLIGFGEYTESNKLLRPLIDFSKEDIISFALKHKLNWIEDKTNKDMKLSRNLLRIQISPLLQKINPNYKDSFLKLGNYSLLLKNYLKEELSEIFGKTFLQRKEFNYAKITKLKKVLLLEFLYSLINELGPDFQENSNHIFQLSAKLIKIQSGKKLLLTNKYYIERNFDKLIIKKRQAKEVNDNLLEHYEIINNNLYFNKKIIHNLLSSNSSLIIRYKKEGDEIFINNNINHKKLKKFLIEQKVPQEKRKEVVVIENSKTNQIKCVIYKGKMLYK